MYYDVVEQSKYHVTVKPIEDLADVGDTFYTHEEICELSGEKYFSQHQRIVYFDHLIIAELEKWADVLEGSGKKTVIMTDHELVEVLKQTPSSLADFAGRKYMRHGDRIGYYRKRKKKKATRGDLAIMWDVLVSGWNAKYGAWLPHIPRWNRSHGLFLALQKATGYNTCRPFMPEDYQWCRHIWYNTKEYF